jgi:hypothetical protein
MFRRSCPVPDFALLTAFTYTARPTGLDPRDGKPDESGVNGLKERIRVKSPIEGRAFLYSLMKAYS